MPLLNVKQTAERLGVTPSTLKVWRTTGRGPAHVRLSHSVVVYDPVVLDAYVVSCTRQPSVQAFMEDKACR